MLLTVNVLVMNEMWFANMALGPVGLVSWVDLCPTVIRFYARMERSGENEICVHMLLTEWKREAPKHA